MQWRSWPFLGNFAVHRISEPTRLVLAHLTESRVHGLRFGDATFACLLMSPLYGGERHHLLLRPLAPFGAASQQLGELPIDALEQRPVAALRSAQQAASNAHELCVSIHGINPGAAACPASRDAES